MRYACIKDFDIEQGDGITVSLWTQGCVHQCRDCHNPDTWDTEGGSLFTNKEVISIVELLNSGDVHKDLSVLGGEPLLPRNIEQLTVLLSVVKKQCKDVKVWLWTGYTFDEVKKLRLMRYVDILVDGRYKKELHEITRYKGSSNQRVIDVQKSLKEGIVVLA